MTTETMKTAVTATAKDAPRQVGEAEDHQAVALPQMGTAHHQITEGVCHPEGVLQEEDQEVPPEEEAPVDHQEEAQMALPVEGQEVLREGIPSRRVFSR